MDDYDLRSQLDKAHADLAEVIDEVVFAENEKVKAERSLAEYKRESALREESLVVCVQSLSEYVLALEERVITPSIGAAVSTLGDYHLTRSRGLVIQTAEAAITSNMSPSLRDLLDRLTAPAQGLKNKMEKDKIGMKNTMMMSGTEVEDAFWLSLKLAENHSLLASKSRAATAALHKYSSMVNPLPATFDVSENLLREATRIREELSAKGNSDFGNYTNSASHGARKTADALERLLKDAQRIYAPFIADAEASIQMADKLSALQRQLADKEGRISQLEAALSRANDQAALNKSSSPMALASAENHQEEQEKGGLDSEKIEKNLASSIHVVRLLQAEVSDLRGALDEQQRIHETAVTKLKRKNERLSQQLSEITNRSASRSVDESIMSATLQRDYLAKIKAFEMTIHSLNSELGALEEKTANAETRHLETIQAVKLELQLERRDRRAEREEYDTMLNRLTTEIEKLMKENVELKQRIRQLLSE